MRNCHKRWKKEMNAIKEKRRLDQEKFDRDHAKFMISLNALAKKIKRRIFMKRAILVAIVLLFFAVAVITNL